ncbi:hypothetical protein O181_109555 [Austropuccinia psidii MF-1]|uniref:FAR1 domain-containing protein n=1 Tax=Austropuccinia psidii MF-1 TaxID=1389203 RepID=A0A9Q3PQN8_9BASI|nr:hypothetical protein [Austropuccinia psidii MF-1]
MTHNQIEISFDRSGTPNPHRNTYKTVTSRNLDFPFRIYARKYAKSTIWTLIVNPPEHHHDATKNIMANLTFSNFSEQETSQIAQIYESLLMPRQIQAKLCSQRETDSPLILQEIYNQVYKIKKEKMQGKMNIYSLIDILKEEHLVCSSERDAEGHINSFLSLNPLP